MRRVLILGSSGSIGTQALDVIRANRERSKLSDFPLGQIAKFFTTKPPSSVSAKLPSATKKLNNLFAVLMLTSSSTALPDL